MPRTRERRPAAIRAGVSDHDLGGVDLLAVYKLRHWLSGDTQDHLADELERDLDAAVADWIAGGGR